MIHSLAIWRRADGGGMSEPVACYCGGVGDGVVPSLKYWGDALVTSDPVRRGSSSVTLKRAWL